MKANASREIVSDLANLAAEFELAAKRVAAQPLRAACLVLIVSLALSLRHRRRSRD